MAKSAKTARKRSVVDRLPELPKGPFTVGGGRLAHARRAPFVTVVPPRLPAPTPPPPLPHLKPRAQHETRTYLVQIIFPVVQCTSPGDLLDGLVLDRAATARSTGSATKGARNPAILATEERYYKLSALNGRRFPNPLFCTVRGGPWMAVVTEEESCTDGVPNHWQFTLPGVPELFLEWFGLFSDRPAFPNLTVFENSLIMIDRQMDCCAGFQFCTTSQSCIPIQVDCGDPFPA